MPRYASLLSLLAVIALAGAASCTSPTPEPAGDGSAATPTEAAGEAEPGTEPGTEPAAAIPNPTEPLPADGSGTRLPAAAAPPGLADGSLVPVDRAAAGPFDGDADTLTGTWLGDAALTAEANDDERAREMARRLLGAARLVMQFRGDGTMALENRFADNTVTRAGRYTAEGVDGDVVRLATTMLTEAGEREEALTATFLDEHTMVLRSGPEQPALAFVRTRATDVAAPAPPPFSAEDLADGTTVGMRWRFAHMQGDETWGSMTDVVAVTETGPTFDLAEFDENGEPRGALTSATLTWEDLLSHASFPADATTIERLEVTVPAGTWEATRYEVTRDDGTVEVSWFADQLPGPPVLWEQRRGDELLASVTLLSFDPDGAPPRVEGSGDGP